MPLQRTVASIFSHNSYGSDMIGTPQTHDSEQNLGKWLDPVGSDLINWSIWGGFTTQWYNWEVVRGMASSVEKDAQGLLWKYVSCPLSPCFSFFLISGFCEMSNFPLPCLASMVLCLTMTQKQGSHLTMDQSHWNQKQIRPSFPFSDSNTMTVLQPVACIKKKKPTVC